MDISKHSIPHTPKALSWQSTQGEIKYIGDGKFAMPDGAIVTMEHMAKAAFSYAKIVADTLAKVTVDELEDVTRLAPFPAELTARVGACAMTVFPTGVSTFIAAMEMLLQAPQMANSLTCTCSGCADERKRQGWPTLDAKALGIDE